MEAPTGRRKKIILAAVVFTVAVVIIAGIAIGVALGTMSNEENPTMDGLDSQVSLSPKLYDETPGIVQDQWIFTLEDTEDSTLDDILHDFETRPDEKWNVTDKLKALGLFTMTCTKQVLTEVAMKLPNLIKNVRYIETVQMRNISKSTTLWGLDRIDQTDLPLNGQYNSADGTITGAGVNVYVLDTGILASHTQYGGRVRTGADFVGDGRGTTDCNGHGSHCAGTIGGKDVGVAPGVNLFPVRVLGCDGSGSNVGVMNGINWVATNHVKPAVASMSLGGGKSAAENAAVERAITAGVSFAIAAGNENSDACNTSPASATNAVTVGATSRTDARASFSNWGSCLDIFAPGVDIQSVGIGSTTQLVSLSGTSMATPHVAGVMALFLSRNTAATPAQVTAALVNGAVPGKVTDPRNSVNRLLNTQFLTSTTGTSRAATSRAATTAAATTAPAPPAGTNQETGTLAAKGNANFHPGGSWYQTTTSGIHTANLVGPANADFDLALFRWVNNAWTIVVQSQGATSTERISTTQPAGFYSWRVLDFAGSGQYTLTWTRPN